MCCGETSDRNCFPFFLYGLYRVVSSIWRWQLWSSLIRRMVNLVLPKVSWGFLQDLVCICCPKPVRDQVKGINHILLFTAFNDNSFLFINPLTQPILPSTSVSIKLKITVCFCHKCGLWVINKWFPWQLVFQHVHLLKQALGLLNFFFPSPPAPFQQKSWLKEYKLTLHFLKKQSVLLQSHLALSERLLEMWIKLKESQARWIR